jgi:hypothetical protein
MNTYAACLRDTDADKLNALRLAGRTDIAEATRWASRSMDRPFTVLRLSW